jgi:hypothetical protein
MLEAVGHPVVVNPDRALARWAEQNGWEVRRFVRPVRLRDRFRVPAPPPRQTAVAGAGLIGAVVGGVVWWRLRARETTPAPPPTPASALEALAQSTRSFLAATTPRVTRMARRTSFFMAAR